MSSDTCTDVSPAPTDVGVPDLPEGMVTRPRLLDLVEQGVHGSVTLLSAPAGTGKTVLVAHWARTTTCGHAVAWLTLTRDGGADQTWPLLLGALGRAGVRVPRLGLPSDPRSPSHAWLARVGEAISASARPLVLVLDEGDHSHPMLHRSLAALIGSAGAGLRLVLLTRSDPLLPLNRYRLDDQLREIRAADLAFDESEGAELFERSGLSLTPAQVATLVGRTSGWAVGLRLAAMGLAGTADPSAAVAEFGGEQDNVSTYLTTELLRCQPPLLRDVLLRTSIVDAFSPGLFEALTGLGNGQRAMAFMARGNSFIETVPDLPGWYRYQSLVREFLRAQLEFEQPRLADELHHAAAEWFVSNGFLTKAVRHAATVGAWGDAAGYLVEDLSIGSLLEDIWTTGRAATFAELPRAQQGTAAAIVRAAMAVGAQDDEACRRELARARASLADDPESTAACALSIALLESLAAVDVTDVESGLASAHAAEQQLRSNYPGVERARPELALLLATAKARLQLWRGDLPGAAEALDGLPVGDAEPCAGRLAVVVLGLRGLVAAVRGDEQPALRFTARAEELARTAGVDVEAWSWEVPAARAWTFVEAMDLEAAARELRSAETGAACGPDVVGHTAPGVLALVRAHLLWAQGRRVEARGALSTGESRPADALVRSTDPLHRPSGHGPAPGRTRSPKVHAIAAGGPGGSEASSGGDLLIVDLTTRELEVLGLLAHLLTTTEIAATLFISVNTVRTHVRSILRKLAVDRRNDAVRRAWELGLLPAVPSPTAPAGEGDARSWQA